MGKGPQESRFDRPSQGLNELDVLTAASEWRAGQERLKKRRRGAARRGPQDARGLRWRDRCDRPDGAFDQGGATTPTGAAAEMGERRRRTRRVQVAMGDAQAGAHRHGPGARRSPRRSRRPGRDAGHRVIRRASRPPTASRTGSTTRQMADREQQSAGRDRQARGRLPRGHGRHEAGPRRAGPRIRVAGGGGRRWGSVRGGRRRRARRAAARVRPAEARIAVMVAPRGDDDSRRRPRTGHRRIRRHGHARGTHDHSGRPGRGHGRGQRPGRRRACRRPLDDGGRPIGGIPRHVLVWREACTHRRWSAGALGGGLAGGAAGISGAVRGGGVHGCPHRGRDGRHERPPDRRERAHGGAGGALGRGAVAGAAGAPWVADHWRARCRRRRRRSRCGPWRGRCAWRGGRCRPARPAAAAGPEVGAVRQPGRAGAAGGKGRKKDKKSKKDDFFEDVQDWIDDEGVAPGVID